ncbi:hypothetical protein D918_06755 [Trichuris suis]|nr:hypothetical protein D918_06755 [Trichuris suis]
MTAAGIAPLADKIQAIRDYSRPVSRKAMLKFLGMVNFYRRWIPNAARLQLSLYDLIHKESQNLSWSPAADQAFNAIKEALSNCILLTHPNPQCRLALFTDASNSAVGAALNQLTDFQNRTPISSAHFRRWRMKTKTQVFGIGHPSLPLVPVGGE